MEPSFFPDSWICRGLVPLSGAVANMLLAGILGSIHLLVSSSTIEMAVQANILLAVANLAIPTPPLALGRAFCCPFKNPKRPQSMIQLAGAIILTGVIVLEKAIGCPLLQAWVLFLSTGITKWVLGA